MALVGGDVADVRDVDLLMSPADASKFLDRVRSEPVPRKPNQLFSSDVFGTWTGLPLAVEVMAGFSYFASGDWRQVWPVTRVAIGVDRQTLYVPAAEELRALLLGFGREKDIARAALIPAD